MTLFELAQDGAEEEKKAGWPQHSPSISAEDKETVVLCEVANLQAEMGSGVKIIAISKQVNQLNDDGKNPEKKYFYPR